MIFNRISFEDQLFGRMAVSLDFITAAQLKKSMLKLEADKDGRILSQIMLDEGIITEEQCSEIVKFQRKKKNQINSIGLQAEEEKFLVKKILEKKSKKE